LFKDFSEFLSDFAGLLCLQLGKIKIFASLFRLI